MIFDGYTTVLQGTTTVEPGWHTIRLIIADEKDGIYDSAVFIKANSIMLEEKLCYSIVGKKTPDLFPTRLVRPIERLPANHPAMTRMDCGGAPTSSWIPRNGPSLAAGAVGCAVTSGAEMFFNYGGARNLQVSGGGVGLLQPPRTRTSPSRMLLPFFLP